MLQLSPRLNAIIELIVPKTVLVDVGTDHAYVPAHAVLSGLIPRAIATDINQDPLRAARETLVQYGLTQSIDLRLGSGLEVIEPHEAGTINIAGMGGTTICAILTAGLALAHSAKRLVLQPMIRIAETRAWLTQHGFRIVDERMVQEGGHLYQVIAAEPGAALQLTSLELEYGPVLMARREPLLGKLLTRDLQVTETAIAGLKKAAGQETRLTEFVARRERIEHLLSEW